MTRLDVDYEWKLIRKFQKWLYILHMHPIATTRNIKSNFRIQPRKVIVCAQILCQPNTRKCGIKEDLNQNDDRIISLFKFVSQCNLVPFLESGLCNVGNELDNCDLAVV